MSTIDVATDESAALEWVKQTLGKALGTAPARIASGDRLVDDLTMDSLELLDLAMQVEDYLGVELERDQFVRLETVADVAALLARRA